MLLHVPVQGGFLAAGEAADLTPATRGRQSSSYNQNRQSSLRHLTFSLVKEAFGSFMSFKAVILQS